VRRDDQVHAPLRADPPASEEGRMNLIIAPHLDDEVYGCTTFLEAGTGVFYCTKAHPDFPKGEPLQEAMALKESLSIDAIWGPRTWRANHLCDVPQAELIEHFERMVDGLKPETLLLPAPSYNQDHRAVLDAALAAVRPHDANWFVKRVLLYEQPETFGTLRKPPPFNPTYFRPLDIGLKRKLYTVYGSQIREHRSFARIRAIAEVRGMQANMAHAEAFEVLRWVE